VQAENIRMTLLLYKPIEDCGFGSCRPNSVKEFADDGGRDMGICLLLLLKKSLFLEQPILSDFSTPPL